MAVETDKGWFGHDFKRTWRSTADFLHLYKRYYGAPQPQEPQPPKFTLDLDNLPSSVLSGVQQKLQESGADDVRSFCAGSEITANVRMYSALGVKTLGVLSSVLSCMLRRTSRRCSSI